MKITKEFLDGFKEYLSNLDPYDAEIFEVEQALKDLSPETNYEGVSDYLDEDFEGEFSEEEKWQVASDPRVLEASRTVFENQLETLLVLEGKFYE